MRILQLIDSLSAGGAERMAVNISNVLVGEGHYTVLCSARNSGPLKALIESDVHYYNLNKTHFLDVFAFCKLLKIVKKHKIEIVHAHSTSLVWAILVKISLFHTIKVIWHDHLGKKISESKEERRVVAWLSKFLTAIISVNSELETWSRENTTLKKEKIIYIPNFPYLNQKLFTNLKIEIQSELRIVCLANLRPQKDHETLIHAIDKVIHKFKRNNVKLILAGNYQEDSYYQKLKKLISSLDLVKHVDIKGSVQNIEVLLDECHIGILSSVSEGLPVSLLEYGLASLPVVVTNVGQCAEVIDYGRYGKLVPSRDPKQFAEAIEELLVNYEDAKKMGKEFKYHIETNFGTGSFLKPYYQLIETF